VFDRDVNAAANIAARAIPKVEKVRKTKAKKPNLQEEKAPLKTPVARASLKYPGRDRMKHAPTPKRKKKCQGVKTFSSPARAQASRLEATVLADCNTYCGGVTETSKAAIKQGNMTYICRLRDLN
jgi:IS605 family transposase